MSLKWEQIKQNQWVCLFLLLIIYKIYFIYYFYFLSTGFHPSLLEKLHLDGFVFHEIYESDSFILSSLKYVYFIIPITLLTAFFYFFSKQTSWESIGQEFLKPTKYFILFIVLFTSWFYGFSAYNYYFDRPYYFDRFLILLLGVLLFRYTWLLPIFIGIIILWLSQFNFPIGHVSLTDKKIIYEILILFLGFLTIKSFFKIKVYVFWIVMFSLIAANYFIPGIGKIQIGPTWYEWMLENELWVLLRSTFFNHWMSFLDEAQKAQIVGIVKYLNFPMLLFTMIIELFAIFILFRRKFTIALLLLFSVFHIGIFLSSGIFFWKWMIFNLALAIILSLYKQFFVTLFTKQNFIISVILVCLSPWLFQPVKLAWWDTRFFEVMQYEVTDMDNNNYILSGNQMRPYEQFTYQRLDYLVPDSIAIVDNNLTNYDRFYLLKRKKIQDMKEWVKENKKITYDEVQVKKLDNFLETYFENYANHLKKNDIYIPKYATPDHGWTGIAPANKFPDDRPIKSFRVKFIQFYPTEEKVCVLNETYIYEKQF